MNKSEAIERLENLKVRAEQLAGLCRGSQDFKKWHRDTEIAIERIFGEGTRHLKDFTDVGYSLGIFTSNTPDSAFDNAYRGGVKNAISVIESLIDEVKDYWEEEPESIVQELSAINKVELLIRRFHKVARQLRSRHGSRNTIEIEDEYDVQDLFHSLLRIYFDDVRPEEYTPSYAGSASRVDFLLKQEKIIIEIKKTRQGLSAKEVGEQLIIDSQRYQAHPDCNTLVCFVYDPEGRVANPRGIENDLTGEVNGVPVTVFITPEQ
ncbi:hypothetical protein [Plesiomonas shigelloides]|uniref:PD-(D/E)XK nuclease domain-containing protein n=1 Tax=Plesiomonas shigelloides TaxID=703 RepID=UPI0021178843|nr:hypothetical protein [Plesiomonas shigelloides]MCQ8860052.1 hypothetical protein [Plesiomonas shigelloides]